MSKSKKIHQLNRNKILKKRVIIIFKNKFNNLKEIKITINTNLATQFLNLLSPIQILKNPTKMRVFKRRMIKRNLKENKQLILVNKKNLKRRIRVSHLKYFLD